MDVIFNIAFTLACVAAAIFFLSRASRDWKARPPSTTPAPRVPAPVATVAPSPLARTGHPNGPRGAAARALGWGIGIAVMLGTLALVVIGVTDQSRTSQQAALAKARRVCPPAVSIPTRPIGFPADDVMGVRSGMTWRDAEETLKCVSEDYEIKRVTYKSTVTGRGEQTRPVLRAVRGQETVSVALFGPVGQERAAVAWQEKYYDAGAGPPRQSIESELAAHYGMPHEARDPTTNERTLTWTYDPDGRPLRIKPRDGDFIGMASYMAAGFTVAACVKNARLDPAQTPTWDGRCGITIRAEIDSALGASGGASGGASAGGANRTARWRVVVLDQQALARYATPLRAVAAPAVKK